MISNAKKCKGFSEILKKLNSNTKNWKRIGSGAFGVAYDMGDGRVCKLTSNYYETRAADKLKKSGKKPKYLYKVNHVYYLKQNKTFELGLIITPKYKKLGYKERKELNELFDLFDPSCTFRYKSIKHIRNIIKRSVKNSRYDLDSYLETHENKCDCIKRHIEHVIDDKMNIIKKYNIDGMLRGLSSINIGPEDIHPHNILKDKNKYILIDISC